MLDIDRLAKYPEGANTYPSGMSQYKEDLLQDFRDHGMDEPDNQDVLDAVNREWYTEVEKAWKVISQDVNGNGGAALARLFADEHPELQQLWFEALIAGMLLRHKELRRIREDEPWNGAVGHRDALDGRVRINTATFVVGGKDVDWR